MDIFSNDSLNFLRQYIFNSIATIILAILSMVIACCILAIWAGIIAALIVVYMVITPIVLVRYLITKPEKVQGN